MKSCNQSTHLSIYPAQNHRTARQGRPPSHTHTHKSVYQTTSRRCGVVYTDRDIVHTDTRFRGWRTSQYRLSRGGSTVWQVGWRETPSLLTLVRIPLRQLSTLSGTCTSLYTCTQEPDGTGQLYTGHFTSRLPTEQSNPM